MPSARCATRSRPRSSSARRSRSTSRSTCCSATSPGRRATGCPARASRRGSSPTSRSTGRRGARPRTAAGTSTRCSRARRRSRWRSCCGSSAWPSSRTGAVYATLPDASPLIGDGRLERAGLTVEIAYPDPAEDLPDAEAARARVRHRDHVRGPVRAGRGDARRRHQLAARRALRRARRLGGVDARAPRRPALRVPPRRGRQRRLTLSRGRSSGLTARRALRRRHWRQNDAMTTDADPAAPVLLDVARAHRHASRSTARRPATPCRASCCACCRKLMHEADARDDVDVIILTGADPAFCAGLDLKELGSTGGNLGGGSGADGSPQHDRRPGPVPEADQAADRRHQRRRHHRRLRAGAQLRLPRRLRATPSSATPTPASA